MTFGENVKRVRKAKHIKGIDLCEGVGISLNTLSSYERNIRTPNVYIAKDIADFLNCTVDDLLRW